MIRRLVSGVLAAGILLGARTAAAEADRLMPFSDTTRYNVATQATILNAQVFGAVRALDRLVVQQPKPGIFIVGFETNWIWGATQVPA